MSEKLSNEQVDRLRAELIRRRDEILQKARVGLELSMNRDVDRGRDSLDESTEEEILSTEFRLRDREKNLLAKILSAMERLDEGTINRCEDCEEPIGFERLLARPVTTLCIACKELRETQEAPP